MIRKDETISPVAFVLIAFAIAWCAFGIILAGERFGFLAGNTGYLIKYALIGFGGGCAPAYAVFILLLRAKYIRGLGGFFQRIHHTNGLLKCIAITAVFFGWMLVQNAVLSAPSGRSWYECLLYLPIMLVGGGFEEVGWRGLLQPQLEKKLPFPLAATAVGALWTLWHIPLFFIQSSGQYGKNILAYALFVITLSFLFALLYKLTKCAFACMLLHAWNNSLGQIFTHDFYSELPSARTLLVFVSVIAVSTAVWYIADRKERQLAETGR